MGRQKNSAAGAGTPNSANDVRPLGNGHETILTQIPRKSQLKNLLALLPEGRSNAIPMQMLAERLGVDPRSLRAAIARAREAGEIIAGDSAGYYIPTDKAELRRYYSTARKRSLSGLKSLKAVRRKLAEFDGQQRLDDEQPET